MSLGGATLAPQTDLLDDLVVVTYHGNEKSRAGRVKTYVAGDQDPEWVV